MKKTIEEIENESEENFEIVIEEFYESCIRNGSYDMEENAEYFCEESDLAESEFGRVIEALKKLEEYDREI